MTKEINNVLFSFTVFYVRTLFEKRRYEYYIMFLLSTMSAKFFTCLLKSAITSNKLQYNYLIDIIKDI